MPEENKDNGNGKLICAKCNTPIEPNKICQVCEDKRNKGQQPTQPQFKYRAIIMFNDETGEYAFETNVPNAIIGYGMLDFAKKGVDNHITRLQQSKILPAKGGLVNFARRIMK